MREIKFRFWVDGANGRFMIYPDNRENSNFNSEGWEFYLDDEGFEIINHRGVVEPAHHVPMQYTGLKDKNDVEIYEGDIIPSNYNVFSKGELEVQVVRFLDGGFRRLSVYQEWGPYGAYGEAEIADWHDGGCLNEEDARKTKVLGNIYEHPQLLKELEE